MSWRVPDAEIKFDQTATLAAVVGSEVELNLTIYLPEGDLNNAVLSIIPPAGLALTSSIIVALSGPGVSLGMTRITTVNDTVVDSSVLAPYYLGQISLLRNVFDQDDDNNFLTMKLALVFTDAMVLADGITGNIQAVLNSSELDQPIVATRKVQLLQARLGFVFRTFQEPETGLRVFTATIVHSPLSAASAFNITFSLKFEGKYLLCQGKQLSPVSIYIGNITYEIMEDRRRDAVELVRSETRDNLSLA
jgi:hypothetical protein